MSIRKISEALGLSTTTVSWILSGQGEKRGFKKETIERVYEYARTIDYRPNLIARNLSNGFTNTIGLIVPFINDTFYANLIQATEAQAKQRSLFLTVCSTEGSEDRETELINTLLGQRVDGIMLISTKESDKNIKLLQKKDHPFVLIIRHFRKIDTNNITVDFMKCSYELTKGLIERGAKQIAVITSNSQICEIQQRVHGYNTALQEAGLRCDDDLCANISRINYKEDFDSKFETLLNSNPEIDGFFFVTHYLALEAFRYFVERKIDFNSKYKFACIYSDMCHKLICPDIATAELPIEQMSRKAVELLCKNIKDKAMEKEHIVLEVDIQ
ncbi:MAG: LacI family DNA-binding transcriptional regulator [Rikenellaceae bacterium]